MLQLIIRLNTSNLKNRQEAHLTIPQDSLASFQELVSKCCKKLGYKKNPEAKLYNKEGIQIFEDDLALLQNNDVIYVATQSEEFYYIAIMDDYDITKEIGEGGFGKVYLGTHKETKKEVAIKFMDVTEQMTQANSISEIYTETQALRKLDHKNIIHLYQGFVEKKNVIMIMEYCGGGELLEYVESRGGLDEISARTIFIQILYAMSYCHTRGVVHRDLKLENVLFKAKDDPHLTIKVVDFGIAGKCDKKNQDKNDAGSVAYMPPEVLSGENTAADPAIDVWAIGCMLYAMLISKLPFNCEDDEDDLIDIIIQDDHKFPPEKKLTPEVKSLINKMLTKDPAQRISLVDIFDEPWVTQDESELQEKLNNIDLIYEKEQKQEEEKKSQYQEEELQRMINQIKSTNLSPAMGPSKGKKKKLSVNRNDGSSTNKFGVKKSSVSGGPHSAGLLKAPASSKPIPSKRGSMGKK